jgi:aminoglycoside 2''-phosphotransferase
MSFGVRTQSSLARQLGAFLYQLHSIDISNLPWELPITRAPVRVQDWLDILEETREKIYPMLQKYQIEWVEDLFERVLRDPASSRYEPVLIHADFASYHILFDDQARKITGVIDFGMAGAGDPASDIGLLINIYGESFVRKMQPAYPNMDKFLPRARFYAQLIELEWILRGLETGETFWFTAHLAGVRDIHE